MDKVDRKKLLVSAKRSMSAVIKCLKMTGDDDDLYQLVEMAQELREFIEDTIDMED